MRWGSRSIWLSGRDPTDTALILRDPIAGFLTYPRPEYLHQVMDQPGGATSPLGGLVRTLATILAPIPSAASWASQAAQAGYALQLGFSDHNLVQIDPISRTLILPSDGLDPAAIARSGYFRHQFYADLIQGLRAVAQLTTLRMARVPIAMVPPRVSLGLHRIMIADRTVALIWLADQIRRELPGLWRHILGSPLGDIGLAYARAREKLPLADTRTPLLAALRQWFAHHERRDQADRLSLEMIDTTPTEGASNATASLRARHLSALCTLGEGSYLDTATRQFLIADLDSTPDDPVNRAYLAQLERERHRTLRHNVSFADAELARRIFPD